MNHVFGPVASRRLGRSLGVDLVPFKHCSYDCVYCECGPTTSRTVTRREFFPPGEMVAELRTVLARRPRLDSITLAGSGEPTLSLSLGEVVGFLKDEFPGYTVSVLTNGSLLGESRVQEDLARADRVIPTLTSVSESTFRRIHRPHPSLGIDAVIAGMERFRRDYPGTIWLEIFIVPGQNDSETELAGLAGAIERIGPDLVQLNTLDRPPSEGWVRAAPEIEMERIRERLGRPGIPIVGPGSPASPVPVGEDEAQAGILATLRRRPSTVEDLVRTTGMNAGGLVKHLGTLERAGLVTSRRGPRGVFYSCRNQTSDDGGRM